MEIKINSHFHFHTVFPDDESCQKYLEEKKWNGRPRCNRCGNSNNNYLLKTRKVYKCSSCQKQFSVIQETIFRNSKIGLKKWFYAYYLLMSSSNGLTSVALANAIEVQQKSAWLMLQKIRQSLIVDNMSMVLSGVVEADETWIGSNPTKDLRLKKKIADHKRDKKPKEKGYEHLKTIMGMIDRDSKKLVLRKIGWYRSCLTNEIANTVLARHVDSKSTMITDGDKGYSKVHQHFDCHQVIVKDKTVKIKMKNGSERTLKYNKYVNGKIHVNNIENVWRQLRRMVSTHIQISYKHMDKYIAEFAFRWNRREMGNGGRMDDALVQAFQNAMSYKELIRWRHEYQSRPWTF